MCVGSIIVLAVLEKLGPGPWWLVDMKTVAIN